MSHRRSENDQLGNQDRVSAERKNEVPHQTKGSNAFYTTTTKNGENHAWAVITNSSAPP